MSLTYIRNIVLVILSLSFDAIVVPQGQEYRAVCKAIEQTSARLPIISIPIGTKSVRSYLTGWLQLQDPKNSLSNFLLCGLCGSLSREYNLGDIVLYRNYIYPSDGDRNLQIDCEESLIKFLDQKIEQKHFLVRGLTSDRIVCSAREKRHLNRIYQADVVDMEGFAVQQVLEERGNRRLVTIRVISDDASRDLPNLEGAIDELGNLSPLPLAIAMLKQPVAASRLITGSLRGLEVLEQVIIQIFS